MSYYLPVKIIFGKNCLQNNAELLQEFGKKALIVTGGNSAKKSGALSVIWQVLADNGQTAVVFDKIRENPSTESVMEGAAFFKTEHCDFLIALGGGSPVDAAKAIGAVTANNLREDEIFTPTLFNNSVPLIAVPLTAGTGSEVTPYSILTNYTKKIKAGFGHPSLFPKIAFLDPLFTLSVPEIVTRDTAIDALSHLLEGIYSKTTDKLTYPLIYKGIELIINNLNPVLENAQNIAGREKLMQAALYGGMTIAQSGTTLQHSLGYPLTSVYGLSHGLTNGLVMEMVMELFYDARAQALDELFQTLKLTQEEFFAWLEGLQMKMPTKITDSFLETRVQEVLGSRNMSSNPIVVNEQDIIDIYKKIR